MQQAPVDPKQDETEAEAQPPQVDVASEPVAARVHVGSVLGIDDDLDAWFGHEADPAEGDSNAEDPEASPSTPDDAADGDDDIDQETAATPTQGASLYWGDETPGEAYMPPLAPTQPDGNRLSFYFD